MHSSSSESRAVDSESNSRVVKSLPRFMSLYCCTLPSYWAAPCQQHWWVRTKAGDSWIQNFSKTQPFLAFPRLIKTLFFIPGNHIQSDTVHKGASKVCLDLDFGLVQLYVYRFFYHSKGSCWPPVGTLACQSRKCSPAVAAACHAQEIHRSFAVQGSTDRVMVVSLFTWYDWTFRINK